MRTPHAILLRIHSSSHLHSPEISHVLSLTGPQFHRKQVSVLKSHNIMSYHILLAFDIKWNTGVTCGQNTLKSRCYSAVVFRTTIMKLNLYPDIKLLSPITHILFMLTQ